MSSHLQILNDPLIEHAFQEIIVNALRIVPNVAAALVAFVVAAEIGSVLDGVVTRAIGRTRLNAIVADSPLGEVFPEEGLGAALGTVIRYYVVLVALIAITNTLGYVVLLQWLTEAALYVPALVGGVLLLVFGVAGVDRATRQLVGGRFDGSVADGVRLLLYAAVALIALETMGAGIDVAGQLIVLSVGAVLLAVAIAVGLGGALALGLGGQEYVADNIERWAGTDDESDEPGDA